MADESPQQLVRLRSGVSACPLTKPYDLSFTKLSAYDSVWVTAEREDGAIGIGEAVPLTGYNWETLDTIRTTVASLVGGSNSSTTEAAIVERCRVVKADHPFAASAVMTALDMPSFLRHANTGKRFPLSAPVAAEWPLAELRRTTQAQFAAGYRFIKAKVGRDLDADIRCASSLLREWPGREFGVVFDANQAYSSDAALAFARALKDCDSDRLQWFEQPVDRQDWDGMERLCRAGLVPIVLDESIYDEADIARASAIGAFGVKLKLTKNFGIAESLSLARRARSLDLTVVFGNGVATDIGNLGEYLVLAASESLFAFPGECSGFAKLRQPLLAPFLAIDGRGEFACSADAATIASRIRAFEFQPAG